MKSFRWIAAAFALVAGSTSMMLSATSEAGPAREAHPALSAGAKADTDGYVAEIKVSGTYTAGAEGVVEVSLVPKGNYHTNDQYPYKFKTVDPAPDGITFSKPNLQRDDGTFEAKRGTFKVPFTAARAGKFTVGGTLYLSVCSDGNCLMDKVPLEIPVDVK